MTSSLSKRRCPVGPLASHISFEALGHEECLDEVREDRGSSLVHNLLNLLAGSRLNLGHHRVFNRVLELLEEGDCRPVALKVDINVAFSPAVPSAW